MRYIVAIMAIFMFTGCVMKVGVALGPEQFRIVEVLYEGEGADTFCWAGAGWKDIGIRPIGWGTQVCEYQSQFD